MQLRIRRGRNVWREREEGGGHNGGKAEETEEIYIKVGEVVVWIDRKLTWTGGLPVRERVDK